MTEGDELDAILLADVGGTNVRFAVLDRAGLGPVAHMAVNDYQNFADGLAAFMALRPNNAAIRYALFGVAVVVEDGRCALTNNAWVVDTAQLRARFGFAGSHIVNDFEAVAWSLPLFAASDLGMIGGGPPKPGAPMVVVGPGTGLGVAAYIPGKGGGVVARSEERPHHPAERVITRGRDYRAAAEQIRPRLCRTRTLRQRLGKSLSGDCFARIADRCGT